MEAHEIPFASLTFEAAEPGLNPSITPPSLPSQPQIVMVIEDFQAVQARQVQVKQAGEL